MQQTRQLLADQLRYHDVKLTWDPDYQEVKKRSSKTAIEAEASWPNQRLPVIRRRMMMQRRMMFRYHQFQKRGW